jgi:hypothetical protein
MCELHNPRTQLAILIKDQIHRVIPLTGLCALVGIQLDFHREPVSLLSGFFACYIIHRSLSHLVQYLKLFGFGQAPSSSKEADSPPASILRRHSTPPQEVI